MKKNLIIGICCCFTLSNALASPVKVPITDLEEFSGLSKTAIMQKRKMAVETSPLFDLLGSNYTSNPDVFQIEDNAPWISAHQISCYGIAENNNISEGPSRESLGILNPELLLHLEIISYRFNEAGSGCSPVDYLIPYLVTYDADKKLITARINYSAFLRKNKRIYNSSLMDANARDLGYNYVFVNKTLPDTSSVGDGFLWKNTNNVTKSVIETKGFYHLGSNVCQKIGGCNNYSPAQPEYDFYVTKLPSEMHFKLWKNMPNSTSDKADISYHLIFD